MLDLSEDIVSVFCVGICTHTKSDERKGEGEEMGERQQEAERETETEKETGRNRGKEGESEQERDLTEKEILLQREFYTF